MSMKREVRYERRQAADRMEAFLLGVTAVAGAGGIFAFLNYGVLAGLAMWVLSALAFALSRLFELIGELFRALDEAGEGTTPRGTGESPNKAQLSTVRPIGMPTDGSVT
jgi:hypothetical protein